MWIAPTSPAFDQVWSGLEAKSAERSDEVFADLFASSSGLELVHVEVHGDRGAGVPHSPDCVSAKCPFRL
jgi:hypothetical protein